MVSRQLLEGVKVLDLAGEPLAMAGRMLADMGAEVIKLEPPGGDPLRRAAPVDPHSGTSLRFLAWNAGKTSVEYNAADPRIDTLLQGADVVIATPRFPGVLELSSKRAPQAVWLQASPFGLHGPRANWRASDLGIMAACGNMNSTGFLDRAPLRCSEPAGYAHASAEAVFAILSALATGRPQVIDLSIQETMMIANMGSVGQSSKLGDNGKRLGASLGKTREIWPCKDGFISFGLRGGPARLPNFKILLQQMKLEGLATPAWTERDWAKFNPQALDDEELNSIEAPLTAYFSAHTMAELYQLAVETKLMLAPVNSATDILASEQLHSRNMFATVGGLDGFPARFFLAREPGDESAAVAEPRCAPQLDQGPCPAWPDSRSRIEDPAPRLAGAGHDSNNGAWRGLKLVEFGSGAAGPITSRYFVEHGATVVKVESRSHPDFLRVMSFGSPHGLEGGLLFDALNAGKHSITINLKNPRGKDIARQLIHWADAVVENFAPSRMQAYGLDYQTMAATKPELLMLSTCLNGQTGPHKDYPGFGGQGAALSGFNFLTGWPDREPIGPFGTITDSLAPRFSASALAAALLYRRRTGRGMHLDISQVESGVYSLSPWLLEQTTYGHSDSRRGNRSRRAVPHGAFPCRDEDRWITIACWTDQEWQQLATIIGVDAQLYSDLDSRLLAQEEIESLVSAWTSQREADEIAEQLQSVGLEAVPVVNFEDLLKHDQQLAQREHFVRLDRPVTGESVYERNGFRLSAAGSTFNKPSPLLGEHTQEVLVKLLGFDLAQLDELKQCGAIE